MEKNTGLPLVLVANNDYSLQGYDLPNTKHRITDVWATGSIIVLSQHHSEPHGPFTWAWTLEITNRTPARCRANFLASPGILTIITKIFMGSW